MTVTEYGEKGRQLEERIGAFFALNGYETQRNVILEGRSGGRHEIDVLAEKSDGVVTFRVAVECKAWHLPIEKDVVTKFAYVIGDLGLNKGIIVSLHGWRVGAEQAAQQLGLELWGPQEIEKKLGQVALAEFEAAPAGRVAQGFPLRVSEQSALAIVYKQTKGFLGLAREDIAWGSFVWLPFHLMEINVSKQQKERFRRTAVKTTTLWNLYDALAGKWYRQYQAQPGLIEVQISAHIPPRVKEREIAAAIRKAFQKLSSVVTESALARHARRLQSLGIPPDAQGVSFDYANQIYLPFYAAVLERRGARRVVAVDGYEGTASEAMGPVLTSTLSYLEEALRSR
jgi:hypothetical protein